MSETDSRAGNRVLVREGEKQEEQEGENKETEAKHRNDLI